MSIVQRQKNGPETLSGLKTVKTTWRKKAGALKHQANIRQQIH